VTDERAKRKLSAILSADVKGYSRLMGEDELGTVRTLEAYREMITEVIRNFSGRVVDSPGDNLLAEFTSVVNAVESAVEIQRELKAKNAELPEDRRMEFRIGINLGDVIEEGERIYGDGVNVAARIEGLAEGGGICISGTAFDHVEGKLGLKLEYLGERIEMEGGVSDVETRQELPLPDKPSIAVLPFVNMSGDPEREYFSDGISEEIITGLSNIPQLFVIARNSSFSYKGKPIKVQQVGRELGVRYVVEGSVRKAAERVRITAQLIDATTGHHLWAHRYDRDLKDIFVLQDEITMKIMTALQVKLTEGEQAQVWARGTSNLEAYEKTLEGRQHWYRFNKEGNIQSRQMAEEAIAMAPAYPSAYLLLAWTHILDVMLGLSKFPEESIDWAGKLAQKAIALDKSLASAHSVLGYVYLMKRQHDKAIAQGERAVSLSPSAADSHALLGRTLHFMGRSEEALSMYDKAIRLNPLPPSWYYHQLNNVYLSLRMYEEAINAAQKAIRQEPNNLWAHIGLMLAYDYSGRDKEAHAEAAKVLKIDPKFSVDNFGKALPFKSQAINERVMDALRKAGLK
jgi:adenylate cyclase